MISAPASVTHRYDGAGAAPLMQSASKPVRFRVAGHRPPNVESKKSPVRGDFADHAAAAVPGHGGIRDGAHAEHDGIRGIEGVHARRDALVENARGEAVAPEEGARRGLVERLAPRGATAQIDEELPASVPFHRRRLSDMLPVARPRIEERPGFPGA